MGGGGCYVWVEFFPSPRGLCDFFFRDGGGSDSPLGSSGSIPSQKEMKRSCFACLAEVLNRKIDYRTTGWLSAGGVCGRQIV